MKIFDKFCEAVVRALGLASLTGYSDDQQPLGGLQDYNQPALPNGPRFKVPNSAITCDYSAMKGYKFTGGSQSGPVGSWLEPPHSPKGLPKFNIFTDYENATPQGIIREYTIDLINGTSTNREINADGVPMRQSKIFNSSYPGPWIQACWGDTLIITVKNALKTNGTSIHWHGIRQLGTWDMDGVNAITQCAVAPNDTMVYTFQALQYGTSWYHSHYSLQYPDGALGPLTIFGPSSSHYDDALDPWLVTDWSHTSAFSQFHTELAKPPPPMDTILLNGTGTYNCTLWGQKNASPCPRTPGIFNAIFRRGQRYLVRLINTSAATTFVFSVDKHIMKVIGADFVPIRPYYTDSVFVGIGQRYHVVIEANPADELSPVEDQNYWIRAIPAAGCNPTIAYANQTVGVIRYSGSSKKTPTTTGYLFNSTCRDEPYPSLVPIVQKIAGPAKNPYTSTDDYVAGLWTGNASTIPDTNFTRWSLTDHTMYLNFSDPSINHIEDTSLPPEKALIYENYGPDDWVYLIIEGTPEINRAQGKTFTPLVHPIHLHGHDFLLLAQQSRPFNLSDVSNPSIFNYNNPPRRDVVLLPSKGYIAIAFKTDNPGIWILHCHIAWHASSGLAMQIMERQKDVIKQASMPGWRDQTDQVCGKWETWLDDPQHWFDSVAFQEDSGI